MNDLRAFSLQFSYADTDFLHIARFYRSTRNRAKVGRVIWTLLFAVGTYYFLITGFFLLFRWATDRLLVTGLYLLIVLDALESWFQPFYSLRTSRWLRRSKLHLREYEFTFDELGARYSFKSESGEADVRLSWSEFEQLLETDRAFLLVVRDDGFWGIPKRALPDEHSINSLRALLSYKVETPEQESNKPAA